MTEYSIDEEIAFICRGAEQIVPLEELKAKLKKSRATSKPLRVKYGIDPTSPHVHLGHTIPLGIFRRFQECGHQGVIIIGDYTARVGDPTGKSEMRPQLSGEQVDANAKLYFQQIRKVVHIDKAEVRYNGEWFGKMNFADMLKLTGRVTIAQILEREDFTQRFKAGTPIGLHEFLYPLMQGWDSVEIHADVELGGSEQLFNLNVGRELQKQTGQEPQVCVTVPILVGTDGVKRMGKSLGNYIAVAENPIVMFEKIMSVPDATMAQYFQLLTTIPDSQWRSMHPNEAKQALAAELVRQMHSSNEAEAAKDSWRVTHQERQLPSDIPDFAVAAGEMDAGKIQPVRLLVLAGFAKSNGEARRLIEGKGVTLNQQKIESLEPLTVTAGDVLAVGRRKFCKLVIKNCHR